MTAEGVIRFVAEHQTAPLPEAARPIARALSGWREILVRTGLVGQDPLRYGGDGFGNVSGRVGPFPGSPGARAFVITGSQTGDKARLGPSDYCVVDAYDEHRNRVRSTGPLLPSSESLTHGALYDLSSRIHFVLHAHSPAIWLDAAALGLPITDPAIEYGTPEMAREMARLHATTPFADGRVLVMGGHEDGVVAVGETLAEAGGALLGALASAYARGRGGSW